MTSRKVATRFDLLSNVRVLDLSQSLAGSYCTKLFVDAGAQVTKLEPRTGDPLRRWSASGTRAAETDSVLFRFLNASKKSVVGDIDDVETVSASVDDSALLVETGQLSMPAIAELRLRHPKLTIVSITPFGRTGPWANRPSTEFTMQALAGSTASRGRPDREPIFAGGALGDWVAGTYGAVAALGALQQPLDAPGEHVDLSAFECMAIAMHGYASLKKSLGGSGFPVSKRQSELPSVIRCADGFVCLTTNSRDQFDNFLLMIDRADLLEDEGLKTKPGRDLRRREFDELVSSWSTRHTMTEVLEAASAFRVPAAPLGQPSTVMESEQAIARGMYVDSPDGGFRQPRSPMHFTPSTRVPHVPAPRLGDAPEATRDAAQHTSDNPPRHAGSDGATRSTLPFAGVRVLDMTGWWAGPSVGQMMGVLGADVIKIESIQHPDGMRLTSTARFPPEDHWWETGFLFQIANVDKRGITLNLQTEEGLEVFWRLASTADAIIENFSPRVLDGFGITWEKVHSLNPRTTLVRMPAFGLDGPWRDRTGFAQTMEAVSGMAWMTGYRDGIPVLPLGPCDPLAGMHATFALLCSLWQRNRTGQGLHVEVPMVEGVLNAAAEIVLEWSANGVELERDANRGPDAVPQGVYPCDGDDEWVAVAVTTDEQWNALAELLGRDDWATSPELADEATRRRAHDQIDEQLAEWSRRHTPVEAAELLTKVGVPAARVVPPVEVIDNPQFRARGFIETIHHPLLGEHEVLGIPFRFSSRTTGWIYRCAPMLGQHNDEILMGELGYTAEQRAEMRAARVIGERVHR